MSKRVKGIKKMKKILQFLFLLILASCSSVQPSIDITPPTPQPIFGRVLELQKPKLYGQDTLGAAKFPKVNLQNLPQGQGQGHFTNTFGDALPLIKQEVAKGVLFERLHLMWKDGHNFSPADFPAIVKEARRICPVIQANPTTQWYLSGACEHNLNEENARELAHQVEAACPYATYVNTPNGSGGAVLLEYINESHGGGRPKGTKFAFSCDGTPCEDSDIEALKRTFAGAEYFFIWGPRYNGRWESNDHTPRPNRKGWPDANYIKSLVYLATDKGFTSLPPKYLWKSHSENKGNGDKRAEHPVAIIPPKVNSIILKRGEKIVGVIPYYGVYSDGRFRYYDPKWGFERGRVDIWIKGKKVGTVNGGFRDGSYPPH